MDDIAGVFGSLGQVNTGAVLFDMGHENAAQIRRRVTFRATDGKGVAHNAGTVVFERVRRAYDASRLDFPQQGLEVRGRLCVLTDLEPIKGKRFRFSRR